MSIIRTPSDSLCSAIHCHNIFTIKLLINEGVLSNNNVINAIKKHLHDYYYDDAFVNNIFPILNDAYDLSDTIQCIFNNVCEINIDEKIRHNFLLFLLDNGAKISDNTRLLTKLPDDIFFNHVEWNDVIINNSNCKIAYDVSDDIIEWIINNNKFDLKNQKEIVQIIFINFDGWNRKKLVEHLIQYIDDYDLLIIIMLKYRHRGNGCDDLIVNKLNKYSIDKLTSLLLIIFNSDKLCSNKILHPKSIKYNNRELLNMVNYDKFLNEKIMAITKPIISLFDNFDVNIYKNIIANDVSELWKLLKNDSALGSMIKIE